MWYQCGGPISRVHHMTNQLLTFPEAWTAKQVKANIWRFDRMNDFEDIMQDARFLFCKLERKYSTVGDPAHLFALYKTSLSRMFIDKSRKKRDSLNDLIYPIEDTVFSLPSNEPNLGTLALILDEMPDELKTVLKHLTTGRVRLKLNKSTKKVRYRENLNMRLKRRFSLTTADPVGDLKAFFNS